jgi:outer membrane protein OmpA-like peptidoglycan-associated protein
MKNTVLVLALIFTLIASTSSFAQSTTMIIEDVILFNNQPFMVKMTPKGKIIEFVRDLENNYNALNKIKPQTFEMSEKEVMAAIDLARKDGNTLDVAAIQEARLKKEQGNAVKEMSKKDEVISQDMSANDHDVTAIADNASNLDEEVMAKGSAITDIEMNTGPETTNYAYEFAFDHRDASLSPSSVNQLNEIANIMKADTSTELEINSYFSESVDISRILSRNRSKGIHDMLVSKGIDSSRIKISESNNEDWANNRVKVSIH